MVIIEMAHHKRISPRIQIFNLWPPGLRSATLTRRFLGRRELRFPTSDPRREKPVARNEVEGFLLGCFFRFREDTSEDQIYIISPQGKIKNAYCREKPVARNEVEGGFREDTSEDQIYIISPQGKIKNAHY